MTEERMRRALGLGGANTRPILTTKAAPPEQGGSETALGRSAGRKLDGVGASSTLMSVVSPLQQRVTELERQLATEQQKHDETRQLLQRAEFAVRNLEARSQHDALAQQKELDGERQATVRAQRALDDAQVELQRHTDARRAAKASAQEQARQTVANQTLMITDSTKLDVISTSTLTADPSPPKKRGRPRTRPLPEPKPVRWWTPSFRAKAKS